jgi:hypothetical protein
MENARNHLQVQSINNIAYVLPSHKPCWLTRQASTSWLEEYGMHCMPHPLCSPDLISSDFYLFPTVKGKLEGIQVVGEDWLLCVYKKF